MTYIMAVVYKLEGDAPVEAQEALVQTLPENALYVTNPLAMPDFEEPTFDAVVYYYDPESDQRREAKSILEILQKTWVYSNAFIAMHLGLTEEQVVEIIGANR